jgi:hypothetical protein
VGLLIWEMYIKPLLSELGGFKAVMEDKLRLILTFTNTIFS